MDPQAELSNFYERHIDELTQRCMDVASVRHPFSPLNTLSHEERLQWVRAGIRAIASDLAGEGMPYRGRVYFPRVNELEDVSYFGLADVLETVECALLPDEAILPLLFEDYRDDPDTLLALVLEFRQSQSAMTKARARQQMDDFEEYVSFARAQAIREERERLEQDVYRRLYLAIKGLKDKTSDIYEQASESGDDYLALRGF